MNLTNDLYQMIKPKVLEVIKENLLKVFELSYKFNVEEDLDKFYKEIKNSHSNRGTSTDLDEHNLNNKEPINLITKKPIPKPHKRNNKKNRYSSKYKGVQYSPKDNRWRARVYDKKVAICIGSFSSETEAAMAYDREKYRITNSISDLNFPEKILLEK